MKVNPSTESQPHDELPDPYRIAVQTILAEPMPDVDLTPLVRKRLARTVRERSRRRLVTQVFGVSLAGAAAVALVVSLFAIRPADAWSQVVKNVRKQPWVRMRLEAADKSSKFETWFSPAKRIAAARLPNSSFFVEMDQYKVQQFAQNEKTIYVSEPQAIDMDDFVALDAVLEAFANGEHFKQSKPSALRLVAQSKTQGGSGNDRWIDYALDFDDARRNPRGFRRVFRVPDGSELPTSMTEEWKSEGTTVVRAFTMDYPASGPADIFALDVPKDAKVVDNRSDKELKSLLSAYAEKQKSAFDSYTATVLISRLEANWTQLNGAYHVRLNASGRASDAVDFEQLQTFQTARFQAQGKIVPDDADCIPWWQTEVEKLAFQQSALGDAVSQSFCPDRVGYPPFGIPRTGWRATVNPKPFIGPADSVMVTVEDAKSGAVMGRYWLAPDRGLLCVRSETPAGTSDLISTTIVDSAEKSPKGHWYATQLRSGQVANSGDDLQAISSLSPVATLVYRYLVKFD